MINHRKKRNDGFTLIELLIVISIIALLSAITLVNLKEARLKAADAAQLETIQQYAHALELYGLNNNNAYPVAITNTEGGNRVASVALKGLAKKLSKITDIAYADTQDPLCVKTNTIVQTLVTSKVLPNAFANDPTDPACIRTKSDGATVLVYAPLRTQTYKYADANKQVGIIVGNSDETSVTTLCQDIVNTDGQSGFPIKNTTASGVDRCIGQNSADQILGVTAGTEDAPTNNPGGGGSCSNTNHNSSQSDCETDHSYCSDNVYTNQTDCENNGTISGGVGCFDVYGSQQSQYSDQSSCENAGTTISAHCSDPNYNDQYSCENATITTGGYCSNGAYTDQGSCESNGDYSGSNGCFDSYGNSESQYGDQSSCENASVTDYSNGFCSGGGYYDQSSCVNAGYQSDAYCSDNVYSDQWNCENNGATWYSGSWNSYNYYWSYNTYNAGYHWSTGTYSPYTWTSGYTTNAGNTWYQDQFVSSGYTWQTGSYSPNTWTSDPAGVWTSN